MSTSRSKPRKIIEQELRAERIRDEWNALIDAGMPPLAALVKVTVNLLEETHIYEEVNSRKESRDG